MAELSVLLRRMGRNWKRSRQSPEERRASARAAARVRWDRYQQQKATAFEPAAPELSGPLLVITLGGRLCGDRTHRLELQPGSRCGRYRVFADGRFWRDMSLTQLLQAIRRRFHPRSFSAL